MPTIYTFGTSDRTEEDVGKLFSENRITLFVDIRTKRGSRHLQWDESRYGNVSMMMKKLGVSYHEDLHLRLGGVQFGEKKPSLKTFRMYLKTPKGKVALEDLKKLVLAEGGGNAVIACCEKDPRTCHRRLITEALEAEGWEVFHL